MIRSLLPAAALLWAAAPVAQDVWAPLPSGTTETLVAVQFVTASVGYVAGENGAVRRTVDGGTTWAAVSPVPAFAIADLHVADAQTVLVVGAGGRIARTTNGGASWVTVPSGTTDRLTAVSFFGAVGVAGGDGQTIVRSADGGQSWTPVKGGFVGPPWHGAHAYSPTGVALAGQNAVFQPFVGLSTDGGLLWNYAHFYFDNNEGSNQDVHFFDGQRGLTVGVVFDGRGAIARTADGGQAWDVTFAASPLYGVGFATPAIGYAVGEAGALLRTGNAGGSWTAVPSGASATLLDVSFPSPTAGFAVGTGGTLLRGAIQVMTSVPEDADAAALEIETPAPHPVTAATTVGYRIAEAGPVQLHVFDALGREVAVLVDAVRPAGRHTVQLDGTALPAGVYVVRLQSDGAVASRTLVRAGRP